MTTQLVYIDSDTIKLYGFKYLRDGRPNKNYKVCVFSISDKAELDWTTSRPDGYFEFVFKNKLKPGNQYEIRFYGTGYSKHARSPEGDWEVIQIPSQEEPPLVFENLPVFEAFEIEGKSHVDINNNEITYAEFDISNLKEKSGTLKSILIYSKRSDERYDTDYKLLANLTVPSQSLSWNWDKIQGTGGNGTFTIEGDINSNAWKED
ncbi:MAG: hypothetical protein ACM34K_21515, partial [Bacillota bacterium]